MQWRNRNSNMKSNKLSHIRYKIFLSFSLIYTSINFFPFLFSSYPSVMGNCVQIFIKIFLFIILIPITIYYIGKESRFSDIVNFQIILFLVFPFIYFINNLFSYFSISLSISFPICCVLFVIFLFGRTNNKNDFK